MNEIVKVVFDYQSFAPAEAQQIRAAADNIRKRHENMVASAIEAGRQLTAVKGLLEHGQFAIWLEAEFGWTARTAQQYMSAASAYGDKYEAISHLPLNTLYRLAAPTVPVDVREQVLERCASETPPSKEEVEEVVAEAFKVAKESKQEAKISPEQKARLKRSAQRRAAQLEADRLQREADQAKRSIATEQAAAIIIECVGERLAELSSLLERSEPWAVMDALRRAGRSA